jgi:hypothetical protein
VVVATQPGRLDDCRSRTARTASARSPKRIPHVLVEWIEASDAAG